MKKILMAFVLISYIIFPSVIKIGFYVNNAKNMTIFQDPNGQVRGINGDYFTDLMKEMGYEVEWVGPESFARLIQMMKDGKIDALTGFSYLKEREEYTLYPQKPYDANKFWLIFPIDNPITKINKWEDLKDYKILAPLGAKLPSILSQNEKDLKIEKLPNSEDFTTVIEKMMLTKRVDAVLSSSSINRDFVKYKNAKYIEVPGPSDEIYIGFSKNSFVGKEAVEKYNTNLKKTKLKYSDYINKYEK